MPKHIHQINFTFQFGEATAVEVIQVEHNKLVIYSSRKSIGTRG